MNRVQAVRGTVGEALVPAMQALRGLRFRLEGVAYRTQAIREAVLADLDALEEALQVVEGMTTVVTPQSLFV